MRKVHLIFAMVLGFAFSSFAQTEWSFDKPHSNVGFSVTHMVISDVTGRFNEFDGMVKTKGDTFDGAEIEVTIKAASIDTENEKRDNHLRSPDFFNAEKHPELTFKSKSFKKLSGDKYEITGDLTMNGTTKEVKLDAKFKGQIKDPYGNTRAGFKATTSVDRFEYGLAWNKLLETGGLVVGKTVDIILNVELIKKG